MARRRPKTVAYRVAFTAPEDHLFHVTLAIAGPGASPELLWLPAWTPGSYLIREFARHVQEIGAHDGEGRAVPIRRIGKDSWAVEATDGTLVVTYRVYAFELSVRTSHLDATHAFWNGAALFLTADELTALPATVEIDAPAGWTVTTSLPAVGERYLASDFDELCDCPVHASPDERRVAFEAAGVPHTLAVWGPGDLALEPLTVELAAIVAQAARVFGGLPYDRYLFVVLLTDRGRGGLEHRDGCTLLYPRLGLRQAKARGDFLALAAHELFHAWNVKRLRPAALTPVDYREENPTRLLWFFEGATSYYELLLLVRAGLLTVDRFLEQWGERMTQLARTPGRRVQSIEEASLTAWVKHYRPDENTVNSAVSYYLKGSLVALALDLALRRRGQSLDGLMRRLWDRFGKVGRPLAEDAVRAEAEALFGGPLDLFDSAVSGVADPPYDDLAVVGLRARARVRDAASDKGGGRARGERGELASYLGLILKPDRTVVQSVLAGSPAEAAGLAPEDELVAEGDLRLAAEGAPLRLEGQAPGTTLRLAYFRRDELRWATPTLASRPVDTLWIERKDDATAEERAAFEAWTGQAAEGP